MTVSNGGDLVFSGVAFIPGYGWIVSGTYFVGKQLIMTAGSMSKSQKNNYWMDRKGNPSLQRVGEK